MAIDKFATKFLARYPRILRRLTTMPLPNIASIDRTPYLIWKEMEAMKTGPQ